MAKPHLYHVAVALEQLDQAKALIEQALAAKLPMLTVLLPEKDFDTLAAWWGTLAGWQLLREHQVRVAVLGKWYKLPENVVEQIKKTVTETKDFDKHFLNLCVNYDGQEEIVDACKLMAMQVKLGRLSPEGITRDMLKENLYSSGTLPPDIIILPSDRLNTFLLWDAAKAKVVIGDPGEELKKLLLT